MIAVVFAIIAVMCGIGWLKNAVGIRALLLYMLEKKYTPPTEEELKACCNVAVRRMFGLKS